MKQKNIIYLFLFSFGILLGQNTRATIQSGPIDYIDTLPERPLCAVPILTNDFITSHLERMKRDYPEVYSKMQNPPILSKTSNIGAFEKFWVMVDDSLGHNSA